MTLCTRDLSKLIICLGLIGLSNLNWADENESREPDQVSATISDDTVEAQAGNVRATISTDSQKGECHISVVSAQDNGKTSVKSEKFLTSSKEECARKSEGYQSNNVDVFYRWRLQ